MEAFLIFQDYADHIMTGFFSLSCTPNDLRFYWITSALGFTPEETCEHLERCHISMFEQLGSLDNIVVGGAVGQPLKSIENIENGTVLMVSWHWVGGCDGELDIEQLDRS
jgi:hypothetical protein